jgi:hypothetical protein
MADYKELLRRAVEALPENNGAARRAVYEKARAALVGQLRAINPPLAARDITAHRLQLEDCIRQVEQEASEAVIAGLGSAREESPPPPPVYFEPPAKKVPTGVAKPVAKPPLAATPAKEPPKPLPAGASIEEIIAAANAEHVEAAPDQTRSVSRPDAKPAGKPVPKLVQAPAARAPEAKVAKRPEPPKPEPEPDYAEALEDEHETLIPDEPIEVAPRAVPERAPQPALREPVKPTPTAPTGRPLPSIVARAEAAKRGGAPAPAVGAPIDGARRGPSIEPRRDVAAARIESGPRSGPAFQPRAAAAQPAVDYEDDVLTAMSAVREVDVETEPVSLDPQGAIDRAIATLDREARADADAESEGMNGRDIEAALSAPLDDRSVLKKPVRKPRPAEDDEPEPRPRRADAPKVGRTGRDEKPAKPAKAAAFAPSAKVRPQGKRNLALEADSGFPRAREERRGISAVTIFLLVFAVLLVGAGGAGFWAWREGYINLDQMFGRGAATETAAAAATAPALSASAEAPATGPGNTAAPTEPVQSNVELKQETRLGADPSVAASQSAALPLQDPSKTDSRLASAGETAVDAAAAAAVDPAVADGSQSLLLEAQSNGTTGAVPYSGTVEWTQGKDEMGLPTLIAKANIPARNLAVDVLIRKNSDPSLPASHLMEVNFRVNDAFVGGSIAGLPGVLLKNEELVQGTPLVGASARVVGNSFLFALSARPEDIAANAKLLTDRKWMDLALIYATGQRAIITLEKDDQATSMFNEVLAEWGSKTAATQ